MKLSSSLTAVLAALLITAGSASAATPKYVFFFLGDGMSQAQIQATEAYLTQRNGGDATRASDLMKPGNRLNMCLMPTQGMQTTYDAHALMTDSASAGTAFACGVKTMSGVIGMDETKTTRYKSVAQLAHEEGKKVGIITSVSLDHATPAAYYASVSSRKDTKDIAAQMAASGYEFFGGGGLLDYKTPEDVASVFGKKYSVLNDRAAIMKLKTAPKKNVVCINPWLQDAQAMPYAMDRPGTNLSLKEMTEVAVACLEKEDNVQKGARDKGFFLMVEGGKIDWACHANDAVAAITDTLDFDEAVGAAIQFAKRHPRETLIVVTGDHETGGMTIGHATTGYSAYYDRLLGQTCSFTYFQDNQWKAHKKANADGYDRARPDNLASNGEMISLMAKDFGLAYKDLNDFQKEKLEDAYDQSMCGGNGNNKAENEYLYGTYEPIIVSITHILNERASIGWTSYAHTGVPVPVYAAGADSEQFEGFYDNTDIAKKLASIMEIKATLPVAK